MGLAVSVAAMLGGQNASGTWSLADQASLACPWWLQWRNPRAACPVYRHC